jgi:hypothetical protein
VPEDKGMGNKEKFDLYEFVYRNYKSGCLKVGIDMNVQYDSYISEDTIETINETLRYLKNIEPKYRDRIRFSDVRYNAMPVFDKKTNILMASEYVPIFVRKGEGNPNELIERFKWLNKNDLPLIDVAKYLNIKVEKSNKLTPFGEYHPAEHKIVMGTDEGRTFIHELSHAIDHILPDFEYEASCTEIIAELSTIILCKSYNIPIDIPYSLYYLRGYTNNKTNIHKVINRVALIYEAVKEIKKAIGGRNNDA